jgi:DNA-3-methyladenine glycosylase II
VLKPRNRTPLPEVLCRAIAGQQLSVKASRTIWGRVVESADGNPLITHIANTKPEVLRGCGLSNSKAKAMKAIVEADAAGQLDVDQLRDLDHDARSKRLTAVWGVGQWTADMMGISFFGDRNVWPESDITVWKTLERLTSRRRKSARTAAHFAPYRSYLALYMWRIADAAPSQ